MPVELLASYQEVQRSTEQANDAKGGANELPAPATFMIDQAGAINLVCVEEGLNKHVVPDMVVKALKKLHG